MSKNDSPNIMKRDETYYIAKTFDYTARFYDRTLNKKLGLEFYSLAAKLSGVKESDKVLRETYLVFSFLLLFLSA